VSFTTSRADLNGSGDLLDRSRSDEDSWRDDSACGNRADPDPPFCSLAVFHAGAPQPVRSWRIRGSQAPVGAEPHRHRAAEGRHKAPGCRRCSRQVQAAFGSYHLGDRHPKPEEHAKRQGVIEAPVNNSVHGRAHLPTVYRVELAQTGRKTASRGTPLVLVAVCTKAGEVVAAQDAAVADEQLGAGLLGFMPCGLRRAG
jgi:hypothetical protein